MLKRRKKRSDGTEEMGGQDSFLDVISNIVGILIILVMIAGVRAQNSSPEPKAPEQAEAAPAYAEEKTVAEIETKYGEYREKAQTATDLRTSLDGIQEQTAILAGQAQLQKMEYAELFDLLTAAQTGVEILAEEKDLATKEKIELQRQIQETDAKLLQMERTKQWIQSNRPQATIMENIPTPISKTVEEKEIHFRLLNGKIVYVPLPELLEKLNFEVGANKNKYFKQKSSSGRVGPVNDFSLDFMLVAYDAIMRDVYGTGVGTRLEIAFAECVPIHDGIGQPLKEALASPNSDLITRLKRFRQDIYTVTVWVYPNSFEEYRELKQFLYSKGYRVAARPLELGEPISGSSNGTKSAAQ